VAPARRQPSDCHLPPSPYAATWANVGACPANVGRQAAHSTSSTQLTALTGDRWCHPADPAAGPHDPPRPGRYIREVNESVRADVDYEALFERARLAATPEACETCLVEIARALESATTPADQAQPAHVPGASEIEPVADPRGL